MPNLGKSQVNSRFLCYRRVSMSRVWVGHGFTPYLKNNMAFLWKPHPTPPTERMGHHPHLTHDSEYSTSTRKVNNVIVGDLTHYIRSLAKKMELVMVRFMDALNEIEKATRSNRAHPNICAYELGVANTFAISVLYLKIEMEMEIFSGQKSFSTDLWHGRLDM